MKILCKTSFKHGTNIYTEGDILTVDDGLGSYFVENGWAKNQETGEEVSPNNGSADLEVKNSNMKVSGNHD